MKKRIFTIANFLGFNVLFFGMYLSFIHKNQPDTDQPASTPAAAAFSETIVVEKAGKAFPASFPVKKEIDLFHK